MAFTQKIFSYQIVLEGGQTINVSGLRSTCRVENAGAPSQGTATVEIYGLPLSTMNALTVLVTQQATVYKNKILSRPVTSTAWS